MSWNDFYQRKKALRAALDHAEEHPRHSLALHAIPDAREIFADTDELIAALYEKWIRLLSGSIEVALLDAEAEPAGDGVQAVTIAWRRTAADHPVLRRVLDDADASPDVCRARENEQRMLALTSGLAEPTEPTADITRAGAAFLRLLRVPTAQATPQHRTCPRFHLRRLIPSL
jgi:hypothetical protein